MGFVGVCMKLLATVGTSI